MFGPGWAARLQEHCQSRGQGAEWRHEPTCVLIVELEEIPLLVQLIGVAVQEGEDGLQLRGCVVADVHEGRLEGLYHGQGAARVAAIPAPGVARRGRVYGRRGVNRGRGLYRCRVAVWVRRTQRVWAVVGRR